MKWISTLLFALLFSCALFSQTQPFESSDFKVSGDVQLLGDQCFRLTESIEWQGGSVWFKKPISLNEPFEMEMDLFFGCRDAGADGIVFIFHPKLATGFRGEGMGFGGLRPALGIEMDTYKNHHLRDPSFDHIAILKNGRMHHQTGLTQPVPALPSKGNIEDCKKHRVKLVWNPDAQKLKVFFDGNLRVDFKYDLVGKIFRGNPKVYWGFSAATGGSKNKHEVCLEKLTFETITFFDKKIEQLLLEGETYSLPNVDFLPGSATLQPAGKAELDRLVKLLKTHKDFNISISGHTDSSGDAQQNKLLSQRRADVVANYLIQQGISKKRISAGGYGAQYPKTSNATPKGRKTNRRVDIYLSKPRA